MDQELEALNEGLVMARRLRNSGVSTACGLPAEVLTSVFSQLQAIWQPEWQSVSQDAWLGWMTVVQVCSVWREVSAF